MKKVKISIAALALILTAGVTFAANYSSSSSAPVECQTLPESQGGGSPVTRECDGLTDICCYELNSDTPILTEFN